MGVERLAACPDVEGWAPDKLAAINEWELDLLAAPRPATSRGMRTYHLRLGVPHRHRGIGEPDGHLTPSHLGVLVSQALGPGWAVHSVRHWLGTLAHSVERDLRTVQELLGHRKIETATVCTKVPDEAMRRSRAPLLAAASAS